MQKVLRPALLVGILLAILATAVVFVLYTQKAFGSQTSDQSTKLENHYIQHTFFSATTTNATSTNDAIQDPNGMGMDIKGAKQVTMLFSRGGATNPNTGSTMYNVQVSPDAGTTWIDYNRLIRNTITPGDVFAARVGTSTIGAATSTVMAHMDPDFMGFDRLRCIAVETTDGEHTCKAIAEF